MSLQTRLSDLITAVGTDYKQLRTWLTGSGSGTLTGLTTTAKTDLVAAVNEVNAKPSSDPADASETVKGIVELATLVEVGTGADGVRAVTPAGVRQERTALTDSLAAVATSGSATDITTGTLPTSVLPPLAINDVFSAATETAMLALVAQRGDVAIRTDTSRSYILATDSPGTLADWKLLTAAGDVLSVAGRVGAVVLAKADVGLASADNTSDASKPVSTAQATADGLRMLKTANLSDVANAATSRTNLSVYSQTQMGNPETDLAALYTTAKA